MMLRKISALFLALCLFVSQAVASNLIIDSYKDATAGLTTVSFVASATSAAATITIPAGAQAGDVAILFDNSANALSQTDVVPTNWTGIATNAGTASGGLVNRIRSSYKILIGGDAGTSITGMTGIAGADKVMFVFRGDVPITSVTPSTFGSQVTTGNPTSQTVSASGQPIPLIVVGCVGANNTIVSFSTASPAFDATVENSETNIIAGYKIYNSSPSNHSVDANDLGPITALQSGYLLLN